MKKTYLFRPIILLFLIINNSNYAVAQTTARSVYLTSWQIDAPIIGMGVAFPILNKYVWTPRITGLTPAQIQSAQLNIGDISAFDRPITQNLDLNARKWSDLTLAAGTLAPTLLFADPDIRRDAPSVATLYAQTFLTNYLLTTVTKQLVQRPRPFVYNPNAPLAEQEDNDARFSFFSGHVSTVASMSFFSAKVYSDYHPNSKATPWIWATAALLPAATAYLRMHGGKHFPTDVIVGYLVGATVGILIPELHRRKSGS